MSYNFTGLLYLFQIMIVILKKKFNKTIFKKKSEGQYGAGRGQHGATKRGHGAAPCQKRLGRTLTCVTSLSMFERLLCY